MQKKFDPKDFVQEVSVMAVKIANQNLTAFRQKLGGHLFKRPLLKCIVVDPEIKTQKFVLFGEEIQGKKLQGLPSNLVDYVQEHALDDGPFEYPITLTHQHFSIEEMLKHYLPKEIGEIPSSFETVGHIAHVNLREQQLPYKHIIGEVFLAKNPKLKTIVNKTDNIATVYRTFPMEIIAGEDDLNVEVHESKVTFQFNYGQVYWNSRLQKEHWRKIQSFSPKDIICDMMCGIGPFAIPLAKHKGCKVYANDLNPASFQFLKQNMKLNHISDQQMKTFNLDGRIFVHQLLEQRKQFTQVLMNLPASALEFLDTFAGKFDQWEGTLPTIHCYCFSSSTTPEQDIVERAEQYLGGKLSSSLRVQHIRDVSPKKQMYCLIFALPSSIAYSCEKLESVQFEKRQKTLQ